MNKTKRRKTRRKKKRGGASQNYLASQESFHENDPENWNRPSSLGYRNHMPVHRPATRRPATKKRSLRASQNNSNDPNYRYDGDEDSDGEDEDVEQDYVDYQEYIDDLTGGWREGCATTTLREKLYLVDREIEKVATTYDTLVKGIAEKTLGDYIATGSLSASHSSKLLKWEKNASRRASEFQRISEEDLNQAFLYLLPTFDASKKFMILGESHEDTPMHVMIRYYAYKMITALFTRSNITYALIQYDKTESPHQFLENLLGVMRSASRITNQYLREEWGTYLKVPMDRARYVHSGGNMIVMIAGMLCYLYDTYNSKSYIPHTYADTLLDRIRQSFEQYLNQGKGADSFYRSLTNKMETDKVFRDNLQRNTDKISDLDLIFMAPDGLVDSIQTNANMAQINQLTAYVLRKIMVTAHRGDSSPENVMAHHVMPFAGRFGDQWKKFKFSNLSGILPDTVARMRRLHQADYYGYRQSSNLVREVPMYLNRIKQGYQPFFGLDLSDIPEDLQYDYSNKYGECLDCSIGDKTNPLYHHKQVNYMTQNTPENPTGNYYTLDTVIYELNLILAGARDDKYEKRLGRRDFLMSIHRPEIDELFQIMGRHIT